jgi:threonine synthase
MIFTETRGNDGTRDAQISFSGALLSPIASFGGIYSPRSLPPLPSNFLGQHLESSYQALSLALLEYLDIDIESSTLRAALALYDRFDDPEDPVPVVKIEDRLFVSELYHGPTRAFKDMALQPFGLIFPAATPVRRRSTPFATVPIFASPAFIRPVEPPKCSGCKWSPRRRQTSR